MARIQFTKRRLIGIFVFIAIVAGGALAFRDAGQWLVLEDPIATADAIVVLSGGMPYRAEGAVDLYRRKCAPEIWITRPENPGPHLAEMGIQFIGEEEYSREIVIHKGVPPDAVRILVGDIVNTEEEINQITHEMQSRRKSRVIVITSPPHTRRVRVLWNRLAATNQVAIIEAAREDPFDRHHWWRNTRDMYAVVREYMGLINAWLGLTVRPHN